MSHPQLSPNVKEHAKMPQSIQSALATLRTLQAHTAIMAKLTQAAPEQSVTINRYDLQHAFADIEQTVSGLYEFLSNMDVVCKDTQGNYHQVSLLLPPIDLA